MNRRTRVAIIGTGYIARGLVRTLRRTPDLAVGAVLTRRIPSGILGFDDADLVISIDEFLERADMVVECSGDVVHATNVIDRTLAAGLPVVTMSSEWHITAGSAYRDRGCITEAEGDQAGSLAALAEDARAMGFDPVVYVNVKGYLNHDPSPEDMDYHGQLRGISLAQVTAFTDGSKVQIEQAHVANGLGAGIVRQGLLGPEAPDLESGLLQLAEAAEEYGAPIVDYVLTPDAPGAIVILARCDSSEVESLRYYKLDGGPLYRLLRPYHLCHLEIIKTIRRVLSGGNVLLDNGPLPSVSVAALTKRPLSPGHRIERGLGGFSVRGECVRIRETAGHVPITLLQDATVVRPIAVGEIVTFDDVEVPDSLALGAWRTSERKVLQAPPDISRITA